MDERENLTKINNDIERQVSVCSKLDTLGRAFNGTTTSIGVAFEPTRALSEVGGVSKAVSGIGTPIQSVFAADSPFRVNFQSITSSLKFTPTLAETSGISKVASGIGTSIKSGSVIDGLSKSVFAAENSFKAPDRSLLSAFESTRALSEASGISKAVAGIGDLVKPASRISDLLGQSALGAAIEAALPLQKTEHLSLNKLFNVPDYQSSVIAQSEPVIVQYPPREVFREVEILKEILTPEYDREIPDEYEVPVVPEETFLEDRLRDIDRGLPNLLQGARHALSPDNPDRARHVTVSLRELIGRVLHHLAPDNSIRDWTNDSSYYHGGRPTRKARLLYISREINADDLSEFVNAEVTLAIKLIDLLNGGTHVTASRLTDRQLQALVTRTELLLSFLLHLDSQ